jgi:hypothetical protein
MDKLEKEIQKRKKWAYQGQRQWSFIQHATTFGASILSLSVVAITQVKNWDEIFKDTKVPDKDFSIVIVSLLAAILSSFATIGGFERKWAANRMTRSKLDELSLDLDIDDSNVKAKEIKEKLQKIIREHDEQITQSK